MYKRKHTAPKQRQNGWPLFPHAHFSYGTGTGTETAGPGGAPDG